MTIHLPIFFLRQRVVPFETVIAVYCIYTSLTALVGFGLSNNMFARAVPFPLAIVMNLLYVGAGLCMYFGIGLGRPRIEGIGLWAIIVSLLVRSAAVTAYFWLNPIVVVSGAVISALPIIVNNNVINLAFIVACLVRLDAIFSWRILVEIQGGPKHE